MILTLDYETEKLKMKYNMQEMQKFLWITALKVFFDIICRK